MADLVRVRLKQEGYLKPSPDSLKNRLLPEGTEIVIEKEKFSKRSMEMLGPVKKKPE